MLSLSQCTNFVTKRGNLLCGYIKIETCLTTYVTFVYCFNRLLNLGLLIVYTTMKNKQHLISKFISIKSLDHIHVSPPIFLKILLVILKLNFLPTLLGTKCFLRLIALAFKELRCWFIFYLLIYKSRVGEHEWSSKIFKWFVSNIFEHYIKYFKNLIFCIFNNRD